MARSYRMEYEWIVEDVDQFDDIIGVYYFSSFPDAMTFYFQSTGDPKVHRRCAVTKTTQAGERLWAYISPTAHGYGVGTYFVDAYNRNTPVAVMATIHKEVKNWNARVFRGTVAEDGEFFGEDAYRDDLNT